MSDDGGGAVNEERQLSDNESNSASVGSTVSDDSGIEDWSDDMTIPIEQQDNMVSGPKELDEKSPELLHPISPIREEVGECIYPALPEVTPIYDHKKDVLGPGGASGLCGLYNLGNTCFMNAAIQCLFATSALKDLVMEGDILQNGSDHMDEPANVLLFVERFQELFRKVLGGKYSILHPDQFHMAIARLHPVLGDYKQHDSQEFLSFLLNTLHDLLNDTTKRIRNHNNHHNGNGKKETSSDDLSDNIHGEVSKRLKMDSDVELNTPMEADAGVECEEHLSKAARAWREYTAYNQSAIVDSFQGQFQSVIICEKCAFVSTTYEPFMSLSLPIPFAMEKQFVVTWVPSLKCALPGMISVTKYCITVNKNSTMKDVKEAFISKIKKKDFHLNTNNIVLAEVDRSVNVCILDDRTQVSYLSKSKSVYAIEIIRTTTSSLIENIGDENTHENEYTNGNNGGFGKNEEFHKDDYDNMNGTYFNGSIAHNDNECDPYGVSVELDPNSMKTDYVNNNGVSAPAEMEQGAAAWHSCGICLEEIFDEELKVHLVCGGMLCDTCLMNLADMNKQQLKFHCPICNRYISTEDFTPLLEPKEGEGEAKRAVRQILVPVLFRHDSLKKNDVYRKYQVFGHPVVCSLPSQVDSETVMEAVNQILQHVCHVATTFDVIVTDGSALSCGLCDIFSTCTGCQVKETLSLKPGSCLSVHFHDNLEMVVKTMELAREDDSMKEFRNTDIVQLDECLAKFGDTEVLTKDNPWYCPRCKTNQMAVKNMTVTRWPGTLIIHLKRFYYEGNHGCKITCPVDFTLNDLNIDILTCADGDSEVAKEPNLYNLYGFICHTGTLLGGHYTALTKDASSSEWYKFNDESFDKMEPNDEHKKEGYVLFYEKKCSR